jgi:hypothetical protein
MIVPGYNEIRKYCSLVDYSYKLTGKTGLWVETYQDIDYVYHVLFPGNDQEFDPIKITQQPKYDTTS